MILMICTVKCILMPPQDLEKFGWFRSRKNNINIWIKQIVDWGIDDTNKIYTYSITMYPQIWPLDFRENSMTILPWEKVSM